MARIRHRRRRGEESPTEDYYEWAGEVNMGTAHGLLQPFELDDVEVAEFLAEQKARDARRIKPGFAIPPNA